MPKARACLAVIDYDDSGKAWIRDSFLGHYAVSSGYIWSTRKNIPPNSSLVFRLIFYFSLDALWFDDCLWYHNALCENIYFNSFIRVFGLVVSFKNLTYSVLIIQALVYLTTSGVSVGMLFRCVGNNSVVNFCAHNYKLVVAQHIFGVITDFLVLGMPIPLIWRLQIRKNHKLILIGLLMIGSMWVKSLSSRQVW